MQTTAEISMTTLSPYLSDHLAGSVAGVEWARRLAEHNPGNEFFEKLVPAIEEDQDALERLMEKAGASESAIKQAGAAILEKLSAGVTGFGAQATEQLGVMRTSELLSMGILGKLSMWQSMQELASADEKLDGLGFDFDRLIARAREQLSGLEEERRRLARKAFLR